MNLKKKFVRLSPPEGMAIKEADRHYSDVHFRFAAGMFRTSIPTVLAYHSTRATGQFDLNGRFDERPDAWRIVITQWDGADDGGHAVGWMDERIRDLFFVDRAKCIGSVSSTEVQESVVVDRRGPQTAMVKYLFRYAPEQFGPRADFDEHYREHHLPRLTNALEKADGVRLVLTNEVLQEAETVLRADGHTGYSGGYLAEATTHCFEEYWFDSHEAADAFFTSTEALDLLRDSPFGKVLGYRVDERCGVDRRR